jgi:DNA polymerase-1
VKKYLDSIREQATQRGYVETLLGRRRYFKSLQNPATNQQVRNRALREAINAPIQGTAADIMKIAMLRVHDALAESDLAAKMLLQVHDEIVLECPQEELAETAKLVQATMEAAYPLDIPLRADARSGPNWGELEPLE